MKILTLENHDKIFDGYSEHNIKLKEPSEFEEYKLLHFLSEICLALVNKKTSLQKIANHLQQSGLKLISKEEMEEIKNIKNQKQILKAKKILEKYENKN